MVRGFSILTYAFEFGFLGVKTADKWRAAMALYILSSELSPVCHKFEAWLTVLGVTWWASYVFFNAIFPKLAHDLVEVCWFGFLETYIPSMFHE